MTRDLRFLNALHAFETAARLGTFAQAGEELGVTPAAVGQQVRMLEDYIGQKLFYRSKLGLTSTTVASGALGDLHRGFDSLESGFRKLREPADKNRLAVSVAPALAWKWLAPRMPRLYERAPEIDLRMDASLRLADIAGGEFDVAIRYDRPMRDGPTSSRLFVDYTLPVCVPELCDLKGTTKQRARAMLDLPLLHIEGETTEGDAVTWPSWCRRYGLGETSIGQGTRYPQSTMAIQAALDGQGVALSGLIIVIDDLLAGRLVAPLGPSSALKAPYAYRVVMAQARRKIVVQSSFIRWLRDEASASRDAMAGFLAGA